MWLCAVTPAVWDAAAAGVAITEPATTTATAPAAVAPASAGFHFPSSSCRVGRKIPSDAAKNGCSLDSDFFDLLARSHLRFVDTPPAGPEATAQWLHEEAPFGVPAHDGADDPRFTYANVTAQRCFEYDWAEFVGPPSRLSAEPDRREDRQALLDAVRRDGFATGYRGRRIAKSGRRFWIEDVTMWNLVDGDGLLVGQAATFRRTPDARSRRLGPVPRACR